MRYGYDPGDRLARLEDHEGEATVYHYNERNEVTAVDNDGRTVSYGHDLIGRLTRTDLPNGVQCRRAFDERDRLLYLNYKGASSPLLTYKYAYNQLGQRVVEEKTSAAQCKLARYQYNPRRELVCSDKKVNRQRIVTRYRYDLNHNRIKDDQVVYQNNDADQLTGYAGPGVQASLAYNDHGQATQFAYSTHADH